MPEPLRDTQVLKAAGHPTVKSSCFVPKRTVCPSDSHRKDIFANYDVEARLSKTQILEGFGAKSKELAKCSPLTRTGKK